MSETIYSVTFDMLNEEAQKRIISNKPTYDILVEATTSQYADVRELAIESGRLSDVILNKMFEKETDETISKIILQYLKKGNITSRNIFSSNIMLREIIAEDTNTSSEDLTKMLQNEDDTGVINAIVENPNFEKTPENMNILLNSDNWEIRLLAAKDDTTTVESLISRLKSEYEDDEDVISAIFDNLSKKGHTDIPFSKDFSSLEVRMAYATRTENPNYLYEALIEEMNNADYMDFGLIEEICNNDKFVQRPINSKIYKIFEVFSEHSIDSVDEFETLVRILTDYEMLIEFLKKQHK